MQFILSVEDSPVDGFVVQIRESGSNVKHELFDSLSRKLAVNMYHTVRRNIKPRDFTVVDAKETANQTYTTYKPHFNFMDLIKLEKS
jgi:1,2-phenylacetyl-CoA epoxidase PaaB subunit